MDHSYDPIDQTPAAAEEEKSDPFEFLPDELIVLVFDRLRDSRYLCRCLVVSKRFASLVYQARILSLKIPLLKTPPDRVLAGPMPEPQLVYDYPTANPALSFPLPLSIFDTEFAGLVAEKFLCRFASMRSLCLEFDYSGRSFEDEPLVKCAIDTQLPARRIFLYASSVVDDGESSFSGGEEEDGLLDVVSKFHDQMSIAIDRYCLMENLVRFLPGSLQNVVFEDSMRQNKLCLGQNELADMWNRKAKFWNQNEGKRVRFWRAPALKLPSSGRVMKMVAVWICKDMECDVSQDDDVLLVKGALYGEDEKVLVEALGKMLKNDVVFKATLPADDARLYFPYRTVNLK